MAADSIYPDKGFLGTWISGDNDQQAIITGSQVQNILTVGIEKAPDWGGEGSVWENNPKKIHVINVKSEISYYLGLVTSEKVSMILWTNNQSGVHYWWLPKEIDWENPETSLAILKTVDSRLARSIAVENINAEINNLLPKIDNEISDKFLDSLSQIILTEYDDDIRKGAKELYDKINEQKNKGTTVLVGELRSKDSQRQKLTIDNLLKSKDASAQRTVVEEWLRWITSGDLSNGDAIEYTAEKMRETPTAILPLVQQLEQEVQFALLPVLQPEQEMDASVVKSDVSGNKFRFNSEVRVWIQEQVINELKRLNLTPDSTRVQQLVDIKLKSLGSSGIQNLDRMIKGSKERMQDEGQFKEEIQELIEVQVKDRQVKVHRRIARLLASMSDSENKEIRNELQRSAVRKLGPRLSEETDPEIRNDLAILLANVGGPQAVDALARAVVGQEQTRVNRQKLLAQYYLDPSREQSKQASKILDQASAEAQKTLTLLRWLNVIVFSVGMIILLAGLYLTFTTNGNSRIAGAVDSVGGLAAIITMLVRDPLDRIQNAMSKLVQVETAFTSFIWELNLNSTYIQSQYVADGILDTSDVAQTVKRIEEAMRLTMTQVASYTEEGRQLLIPHLTKISPVVGELDDRISIYGVNLKREAEEKDDGVHVLTVAINHIPVLTKTISKDKGEFNINLPKADKLPKGLKIESTIWISLIVDDMETNALPYQIIPENSREATRKSLRPTRGIK